MLQVLALVLGLLSWGILIFSMVKAKKYTSEKTYVLYFLAWLCCAIALYIPSLCQALEFWADDLSSVIDCAHTYHLMSAGLLIVTVLLTTLSFILKKKK